MKQHKVSFLPREMSFCPWFKYAPLLLQFQWISIPIFDVSIKFSNLKCKRHILKTGAIIFITSVVVLGRVGQGSRPRGFETGHCHYRKQEARDQTVRPPVHMEGVVFGALPCRNEAGSSESTCLQPAPHADEHGPQTRRKIKTCLQTEIKGRPALTHVAGGWVRKNWCAWDGRIGVPKHIRGMRV